MSGGMLGSCLYLARALALSTKVTDCTRGSVRSWLCRFITLTRGVVSAMKMDIVLALPLRLSIDWLKEWPRISEPPVIISTRNITETAKIDSPLLRQKFCSADLGAKRALVNILVVPARGVVADNGAAVDDDYPTAQDVDDLLVVRGHDHRGAAPVDLEQQLQDLPRRPGVKVAAALTAATNLRLPPHSPAD